MATDRQQRCALCQRQCALTFHHLIPRKLHRRNYYRKHMDKDQLQAGIYLCRPCHSGLHKLFDEQHLAKNLSSLQALKQDEAVMRHAAWVAKQKVGS